MISIPRSGPDSVLRFTGFGALQRGKWHVTSLLGNGTIETPLPIDVSFRVFTCNCAIYAIWVGAILNWRCTASHVAQPSTLIRDIS